MVRRRQARVCAMGKGRHPLGAESDGARLARLERELRELRVGAAKAAGGGTAGKPSAGGTPAAAPTKRERFAKFRPFWGCACGFGDNCSDRQVCWKCGAARPGGGAAQGRSPEPPATYAAAAKAAGAPKAGACSQPGGDGGRQATQAMGAAMAGADAELADVRAELAAALQWPGRGTDRLVRERSPRGSMGRRRTPSSIS